MTIGNRPELYNKTVDVLYQAYFKDELKHGCCTACAVGNICRESAERLGIPNFVWRFLFVTYRDEATQRKYPSFYISGGLADGGSQPHILIKATGYKVKELARVEFSFEMASRGQSTEDYMFNGLVAVLEILKDIHQVEDDSENVTKFKSHYLTLVS